MAGIDRTHDARRRSWVESANGHPDFPIQNLPIGIFQSGDGAAPRAGVAIGNAIVDLAALRQRGLLTGAAAAAVAATEDGTLNGLLAQGSDARKALRYALFDLLASDGDDARALKAADGMLHDRERVRMCVPAAIGDYTDFYAGIHHARAVGALFRPENPLLPNYKHVPIAYHGRASSIVPSGNAIRRPSGQRKLPDEAAPTFGPARNLDYELELGIWIGPGNVLGEPIGIGGASAHIAGLCLLNDWSARDIQAWEYQPLGPFLAKSFATTISPWIVTVEALAPFRVSQPPRPDGDPAPLSYLLDARDQAQGAFDIDLEVWLTTPGLAARQLPPHRLALSSTRHMYWTPAQMVAHHTSGGCNLRPGDLLGSGTISGPEREALGSLLETTRGGRDPLTLASGESRTFLQDGDAVTLRARAHRDGFASIGFGDCAGVIRSSGAMA